MKVRPQTQLFCFLFCTARLFFLSDKANAIILNNADELKSNATVPVPAISDNRVFVFGITPTLKIDYNNSYTAYVPGACISAGLCIRTNMLIEAEYASAYYLIKNSADLQVDYSSLSALKFYSNTKSTLIPFLGVTASVVSSTYIPSSIIHYLNDPIDGVRKHHTIYQLTVPVGVRKELFHGLYCFIGLAWHYSFAAKGGTIPGDNGLAFYFRLLQFCSKAPHLGGDH